MDMEVEIPWIDILKYYFRDYSRDYVVALLHPLLSDLLLFFCTDSVGTYIQHSIELDAYVHV